MYSRFHERGSYTCRTQHLILGELKVHTQLSFRAWFRRQVVEFCHYMIPNWVRCNLNLQGDRPNSRSLFCHTPNATYMYNTSATSRPSSPLLLRWNMDGVKRVRPVSPVKNTDRIHCSQYYCHRLETVILQRFCNYCTATLTCIRVVRSKLYPISNINIVMII